MMPTTPVLPTATLGATTHKYTPYSIRKSLMMIPINTHRVVTAPGQELTVMKMFVDSTGMFGTTEELLEQIRIFSDFSDNNKYFELDGSVHYNNTLTFYDDINGLNKYICKNDLFLYIQKKLVEKNKMMVLRPILIMLTYLLKHYESKLDGACEFIQFDQKLFNKLDRDIEKVSDSMENGPLRPLCIMKRGYQGVLARFKSLLPFDKSNEEMTALATVLENLLTGKEYPVEKSHDMLAMCFSYCERMIPGIKKIIQERREWFMPNAKLPRKRGSKPVIRVFRDDRVVPFVLYREIAQATEFLSLPPVSTRVVAGYEDVVELESVGNVLTLCRIHKSDVEFINVPIKRAKHSSVPIPIGSGLFVKMSVDVLFELLRDMFFGSGLFQSPDHIEMMKLWNDDLATVFDALTEQLRLLDNRFFDNCYDICSDRLPLSSPPKTIRDVSPEGFYSDDIDKELLYLGMDSFFPDVFEHVDVAYRHVIRNKKQAVLRTCDMFDAVEICLMLSFFEKFPKLAHFLHTQQSCYRIPGLQCHRCEDEKENPRKKHQPLELIIKDGDKIEKYKIDTKDDGTMTASIEDVELTAELLQAMSTHDARRKKAN